MTKSKRKPCADCPWRKDAETDVWSKERFQMLAVDCRDDGMKAMACHKSGQEQPYACAGFLAQVGYESVGVRILAMQGGETPDDIYTNGLDLFETFEQMLEANDVEVPRRNRSAFEKLTRGRGSRRD